MSPPRPEAAFPLARLAEPLLRSIRDSVIFTDLEGRIRHWSDGAHEVFGYTAAEALGRTLDLIYPTSNPALITADLAMVLAGNDYVGEWVGRHKHGHLLQVDVRTTVVRGDDGEPVGFLGIGRDVTERRAADERMHRVLDSLFTFVGILSTEGVLLQANRAPLQAGGLCAVDVVGRRFDECWWWAYDPGVQARIRDAMAQACGGHEVRFDVRARMAAGNLMPVDFMMAPVRDVVGRITHLVASFVDISERAAHEEALQASEAEFRGLAESMPAVVFTADEQGRTDYINSRWAEVTGRLPGESLGFRWLEQVHPDDREPARLRWEACFATKRPFEAEQRLGSPERGWRWHFVRAVPLPTLGEAPRWVGTCMDVHEQRLLREALAGERAIAESVLAAAPVGMCVVDAQYRYLRINEEMARINGIPVADHIGRTIEAIVPQLWPMLEPIFARVLATGEPLLNFEVNGAAPSEPDVDRSWLGSYFPIRQDGVVTGVGVLLVDITAQKRAEQRLRIADRNKDDFLATLAHELRNPLSPIRIAVQLLRREGASDDDLVWARDMIDRQVSHLTRLIDDLLDVSRISQGKLVLRRERVALGDVVRAALETSRPLLEARRQALVVELPPEPVVVEGDPVRLAQAITNLLSNSAKYSEAEGRVTLAVRREGDEGVVEVRDTGVGIAPEDLERVFDMFYQTDHSLERTDGGLGIGLALVRQLVDLHGGRVAASSAGKGQGSTFTLRLPLAESPAVRTPMPRGEVPRLAPLRMLVVDDNVDNAATLAALLRAEGHAVEVAHDGEAALVAAERQRPEVVLLDIGMPRLNGYEVCRRLRELPWGRTPLVVAQTGWGQSADRERARAAGFDAHFVKPIDLDELWRLIAARHR